MGYVSKHGRRPMELASKSAHSYIINDKDVAEYLTKCDLPKYADEVDLTKPTILNLEDIANPIKYIIAIDGGNTEVPVRTEFPSSQLAFFQFGALIFSVADLDEISQKPFIDPEDIAKLKEIQRFKLAVPTKNIILKGTTSLINTVRRTIYDFFAQNIDGDRFIDTLSWFIYEEYDAKSDVWILAHCPICEKPRIELKRSAASKDFIFKCNNCGGDIYLTDVFRLHEAIDNELGASGILGYLTTLIEQIILVHLIKVILKTKPTLLSEILFIKDGPLAFFGQTARMHEPMRKLTCYLVDKHNIFLAGLEKSGAFVEHADEISKRMVSNSVMLIDNDYIYKYILPGEADPSSPYGRTSYYGNKVIYKAEDENIYVVTIPTKEALFTPKKEDLINLEVILRNIRKLKCDMYDSSLVPIALVNNLVSLANHPSAVILEKFAKKGIIGK